MTLSKPSEVLKLFRVDPKTTLHNRFRKPLKSLGILKTKCKLIIESTLSIFILCVCICVSFGLFQSALAATPEKNAIIENIKLANTRDD